MANALFGISGPSGLVVGKWLLRRPFIEVRFEISTMRSVVQQV